MSKIRTTHTGSLHRPSTLATLLLKEEETGEAPPGLQEETREAVMQIVARQVKTGVDVVNDGEQGKAGYASYVTERLSGFESVGVTRKRSRDVEEFPDFEGMPELLRGRKLPQDPACTGPITLRDPDAVHRDITNLKDAAKSAGIGDERLFMSSASPGVIAHFLQNRYYKTREEYLAALVDVMRAEYRAIVEAGITLQLDCPDFAMSYNSVFRDLTVEEFRREVAISMEAMNAAIDGLNPELMRFHVCWGNAETPHTHDIALADIVDLLFKARPSGIVLEACNPRHGHEWEVFEEAKLPEDKYLVVGVIDTTTNFVEHPKLVAQRLLNYARLVGSERVLGGTDCGFGTIVGRNRVVESIAWAKLGAMFEGAQIASASL